ncbi:hypothetical protein QLX67_11015 [Balneolaceae bacterium ANBcel3]|nr:hypothetical protein [Balneolaceae bacterium ANBcel3]
MTQSIYSWITDITYSRRAIGAVVFSSIVFGAYYYRMSPPEIATIGNIPPAYLFWSVAAFSGLILALMNIVKRYPFLFALGSITSWFSLLYFTWANPSLPVFFLIISPLFLLYYLFTITIVKLEIPDYSKADIPSSPGKSKGAISGTSDGQTNSIHAKVVEFGKTFIYTLFGGSLLYVFIQVIRSHFV